MTNKIALFDFDGTITSKDTFLELIKYHKGQLSFYLGMILLSPVLLLFKAGLVQNWRAKETVITFFFGRMSEEEFKKLCNDFVDDKIPLLLRQKALQRIHALKEDNVRTVVVSASAYYWVKPWCEKMNLECISTHLEIVDGYLTGKISGKNCYGEEKVSRINAIIDISKYSIIYTYGDSKGDFQMLKLGTEQFYKPFQ